MPRGKPTPPHIPDFADLRRQIVAVSRAVVVEETGRFAEEEKEKFKDAIQRQDFRSFHVIYYPESGTNLSPRWLARKAAAGADLRTAIATQHYVRSINVTRRLFPMRRGARYTIGFHHSVKARTLEGEVAPILLRDLAKVLEFGTLTGTIPPRPHWGPQLRRIKQASPRFRKQLRKRIQRELRARVRIKRKR